MEKLIQKAKIKVIKRKKVKYYCDYCGKECGTVKNNKITLANIKSNQYEHYCKKKKCFMRGRNANDIGFILDYQFWDDPNFAHSKIMFGDFNTVGELGIKYLYLEGYYQDTFQRAIHLIVDRHASQEEKDRIVEEIEMVLPHMIPHIADESKTPYHQFHIFEHKLSEDGIYTLRYDTIKDRWQIINKYYHTERIDFERKNLSEVIDRIVERYWYNDPKGE